jgi:CHRD domain-containing protein/Big-like domain-containing protein
MRATETCGRFSYITRLAAASAFTALVLTACGGGGYGGGGGGGGGGLCGGQYVACPLPMVSLTAPTAAATVSGTVALTATASGSMTYSITVTKVDFFVSTVGMVGTATTAPYTVNWNSTAVVDGSYSVTATVTDSRNGTATTAATMITVKNHAAASVPMTSAQIFPAPRSSASGMASLKVKLETGAVRGKVQLSGVTATAVTINEGFAGTSGSAVIHLTPAAGAAGAWEVPTGALLAPEQVTAFTQGKLYVIATSAANPRGEVRGQIVPQNVIVSFSEMAVTPDAVSLGIAASGVAATTVDTSANTLTIHINSTGVDEAQAAQASTGAKLAELTKDSVNMGHWSTELASLSAADLANFKAGKWQVSVATPAAQKGAIRGQIDAGKAD